MFPNSTNPTDIAKFIKDNKPDETDIDEDKTLLNFLMNKDFTYLDSKIEYYLHITKIENTFNRHKFIAKKNKNNLLLTAIKNSIIHSKPTYPILKLHTYLDLLFYREESIFNIIKDLHSITTQHIIPRKSVALRIVDNKNFSITHKKVSLGDDIYLNPFQLNKFCNGNSPNKIKYTVENIEYIKTEFLYFTRKNYIMRIRPFMIATLSSSVLEYRDFLFNCWNTERSGNYIVYYHTEIICMNEMSIYKLNEDSKTHPINNILKLHHRAITETNLIANGKLIRKINETKITEEEIDELFNPKETIQAGCINLSNGLWNVFAWEESSSDNSDDSDSGDTNSNDTHSSDIPDEIVSAKITPPEVKFNFTFSYNKYYTFEKEIIENSVKQLYKFNSKFKKLVSDYDTFHFIKPISKTYTNQKYFNFILTNKCNTLISQQYHSYINDENEIISLTKIDDILL